MTGHSWIEKHMNTNGNQHMIMPLIVFPLFSYVFNPTLTFHCFQFVFHGCHTFHNFPWPGQPGATVQTDRLPMYAGHANGKCEMCENHEKSIENNEKSKLD